MDISPAADQALRAALFLAQQDDGLQPVHRIAEALGAPINYLSKTIGVMGRAGLVEGRRGPSGGYRLARAPEDISVGEILTAIDPLRPRSVCLIGDRPCESERPCRVHDAWTALRSKARDAFDDSSLADLLGPPVSGGC